MKRPRNSSDSRRFMMELRRTMQQAVMLLSKLAVVLGAVSGMVQLVAGDVRSMNARAEHQRELDCAPRCVDGPKVRPVGPAPGVKPSPAKPGTACTSAGSAAAQAGSPAAAVRSASDDGRAPATEEEHCP
jgi:hypothetical protein